jgi:hypothetical protein
MVWQWRLLYPDSPGKPDNVSDARTVCSRQSGSGGVALDGIHDVYKIAVVDGQQLTIS